MVKWILEEMRLVKMGLGFRLDVETWILFGGLGASED